MSSICVITARGGSKRIPRKNIREFCGKPIIAYSIEAALESGVFDEVMVSTDDEGIADVARSYGASVPFMRSKRNSDDFATTADVLVEVIRAYSERGAVFDDLCCVYPTAPFITPEKLCRAKKILEGGADSVIPVVRFSFPPQRAFVIEESGELRFAQPEHAATRSQDLPAMYHDCGQFYYVRTGVFMKERSVLAGRCLPMEVPETEVQDIDNLVDWEIAESKYERMRAHEHAEG